MALSDIQIHALDGSALDSSGLKNTVVLVVNVASQCGLTPQYEGLEQLQKTYADKGFTVLGVPCNQFAGQEPGSSAEIKQFCESHYGVTFPLTEKVDVNGEHRHALYQFLINGGDDISWNFEKFLVARNGEVIARFSPRTVPNDPAIISAIDAAL